MGLKEKLPLLNSNNRILRVVGYGLYSIVVMFLLLIIIGVMIGPTEDNKPAENTSKAAENTSKADEVVSSPKVDPNVAMKKTVNEVVSRHNGGHEYKVSVNDMGQGLGYNVVVTLLPKEEWSSKWMVKNSANTFVEMLKELYKNPNIGRVYVMQQAKFIDKYGNENVEKAVAVDMTRNTANKINWDNFEDRVILDYNNLFNVADSYYIHPAVLKELS